MKQNYIQTNVGTKQCLQKAFVISRSKILLFLDFSFTSRIYTIISDF